MPLDAFHPAVADWFRSAFPAPTPAQLAAWPAIGSGRNTLVAAPTGSGKTLTAFLTAIDGLVREGLDDGLPDATLVVYVSPLKALSNDIHLNLEAPLAGIRGALAARGLPDVEIRTAVRTGDTPASERQRMVRRPPHVLVTTPESLYVLLGSVSGRAMLSHVRSVIVDEIHAVADDKRGSHLALSLERLQVLCGRPLQRIGLSATQKPVEEVARFLVGAAAVDAHGVPDCAIVDTGYSRERDLALELPPTPLSAVISNDQWEQIYRQVAGLAQAHRTTLVFVNTRRMAERAARHLAELLGREHVAAHHGSLARALRLDAEQRLKRGELKVLVATASLELGIDIGDVELVCQLGSPRSISTFLQRAGRAGHSVGGTPKARLFPLSRDELVECAALLDCVRRGELDALRLPQAPLDVLAQQLVAEVAAAGEYDEDALYALVCRAWPYAQLQRGDHDAVVRMLAEGFSTRRGTRSALLHRDAVNRRLRPRRSARMTALTSGGTIPETGDYAVILEPDAQQIGTVNEDFAVESLAGDVFQLGNASYRIRRVEPGRLRVEDAQGLPPNIPFWIGEAPGRSDELSAGVSRLRSEVSARLGGRLPGAPSAEDGTHALLYAGEAAAVAWLREAVGLGAEAARQLVGYLASAQAALGALPTRERIVLERFFDESGGTQLVLHSPFGSHVNRAWGLALRKRFCRKFNFELQAAATEDAIVLSLSTSHSFPLADVARYLHSASAREVLVQALLDAPLFGARWRWNATNALALPRMSGGRKVAPQLQRMKAEDLLAAVFPDQVACLENIVGEREVPDHPLVAQTMHDCLEQAMDVEGWLRLLRRMEAGEVEVLACELTAPSPLAAEVINARVYAFLDDAPLEERRTQAVQSRRYADPREAADLGRLDQAAIDEVRSQAWPQVRDADEMHDALVGLGVIRVDEASGNADWDGWLRALADDRRAAVAATGLEGQGALWVAAERLPQLQAVFPAAVPEPAIVAPAGCAAGCSREEAVRELVRARLGAAGPVASAALAQALLLPVPEVDAALLQLEGEGYAIQGAFTPGAAGQEWCERGLLARIHRYTLERLRREIEPVQARDFQRFLFDWQRLAPDARVSGQEALAGVLAQLEGYEAPAAVWEAELLPARLPDYSISWLDELCAAGRILWARLRAAPASGSGGRGGSVRAMPLVLLPRRSTSHWAQLAPDAAGTPEPSSRAQRVADCLATLGASFFDELLDGTGLLAVELEDALAELVARGGAHCDSFIGLRALMLPASARAPARGRRRRAMRPGVADAGRWAPVRRRAGAQVGAEADAACEHVACVLLRRYGVVCWRVLEREAAWLPPWRELLRVYRRLEARGEIRGGRFIAGLPGEQFALPEAVGLLRRMRRRSHEGRLLRVAATDPANLSGTVLAGPKLPRVAGAWLAFRDGVPVATLVAGELQLLAALSPADEAAVRGLLLHGRSVQQDPVAIPAQAGG